MLTRIVNGLGVFTVAAVAVGAVAAWPHVADARTNAPPEALATQVHEILRQNCYRCHGEDGNAEGGFNFVLRGDKLADAGYVVAHRADESLFIERLRSEDAPMPPAGEEPRPSRDDIATIAAWIDAGAPDFRDASPVEFVSPDEVYQSLADDLRRAPVGDRKFLRYFSFTHLRNSGQSVDELKTYRVALAKLLNSLSWNRRLANVRPVDDAQTVFRVDLRDLKWTPATWNAIAAVYPYGYLIESPTAQRCRIATESELPLIRGDWFVAAASRPPLYHELLQLPTSDAALEKLLQVDVAQNIEDRKAVRAGFTRSGVSQNNRLIERHDSAFGAYWRSYDFAANTDRKSLFEYPLGPGRVDGFQHDGGEIIFQLPNGLLGFMLVDAFGRRIDQGPTEIVSDPRQPTRAVVNGVSCISCHYAGVIRKADEIRSHVAANPTAFAEHDAILALYPENDWLDAMMQADAQKYRDALASKEIGLRRPTGSGEPISVIANRFVGDVDATTAAAELGVKPADFQRSLARVADAALVRSIGSLKLAGGIVKRDTFESVFLSLAKELGLGAEILRAQVQFQPGRAAAAPAPAVPGQMEAATQELEAGITAVRRSDWQLAQAKLEEALRLAPDDAFRIKVYEQLATVYGRLPTIDKLVDAHEFIIDHAVDEASQTQAVDDFFRAVLRHIRQGGGGDRWEQNAPLTIVFQNVKVPISTATVITGRFVPKIKQNPDHEPTLRVLAVVYRHISPNDRHRRAVLERLQGLLAKRGGELDRQPSFDLASLYVSGGEPAKGAAMYQDLLQESAQDGSTGEVLFEMAVAWKQAGQRDKAIEALSKAEPYFARKTDVGESLMQFNLVRFGDLYVELGAFDKAIRQYRQALALANRGGDTARIQDKLRIAYDGAGKNGASQATDDPLLDATRKFRVEAERLEKEDGYAPSIKADNLIQAAENWQQAGENAKAADAARRAARELRRLDDDFSRSQSHAKLAVLYQKLDDRKSAVAQWKEALRYADNEHDIERYQQQLAAVSDDAGDEAADGTAPDELLDDNYKYRALAKRLEAERPEDDSTAAENLVKAAEMWVQAGDQKQARRVAQLAAGRLDRASSNTYFSSDGLRSQLADVYVKLDDPKTAVKQLTLAIAASDREHQTKQLQQRLTAICRQHDLPLPELDADTARKLDPLNKYREQAEEAEMRAKEYESARTRHWIDAAENWLRAEDTAKAKQAAKKAATESRKRRNGATISDFENLAELFEELGDIPSAKRFYKLAIENTTSTFRKEEYQQAIEDLDALKDEAD